MSNFISVKAVFSLCVGSLVFIGVAHAGDCSFLIKCAPGYTEDYKSCQCVVNTKVDGAGGPKNDADGSGTGGIKPIRTNPPRTKTGVNPNSGSGSSSDSSGVMGGVKPVRTTPPIRTGVNPAGGSSTDTVKSFYVPPQKTGINPAGGSSTDQTGGIKPVRTSPPIGTGQSTDSTGTGKK